MNFASELNQKIDWKKCGALIPAIIQDHNSLEILMLGFMNEEALGLTQKTRKVHFYSRTKQRIWMKGEESKNILNVQEISLDCDNDSLLILVKPVGNTCHKGPKSCFNNQTNFFKKLEEEIESKIKIPQKNSYISKLTQAGINKVVQKVGEEATEVIIAALNESDENLINESADLIFHLMLTLKIRNLSIEDVIAKMKKRAIDTRQNTFAAPQA